MNKSKIEWCDMTWNPVTGCLHGCEYCYARRIANRFGLHYEANTVQVLDKKYSYETYCIMTGEKDYISSPYPYDFYPTFHKYRLAEPQKVKKPQKIFVCSMADLFGDWVPDEWIKQVFDACEKAPQHTYLFLTKNSERYLSLYDKKLFPYKENFWFGTTVTKPTDEYVWFERTPYKAFIGIEPILERFGELVRSVLPNWVIIGAETGNRKGKVIPKREWVDDIVPHCRQADVPVFMKNSLKDLMGDDFIQQWPEGLR